MSNARNLANLLGTGTTIASAKIADDAITNAKIADDAVTGAKIENNPTIAGNLTIAGNATAQGTTSGFGDDDKILLNATDGSATDAGDNLVLNSTDGSSDDGGGILFENFTNDGSALLSAPALVLPAPQQSALRPTFKAQGTNNGWTDVSDNSEATVVMDNVWWNVGDGYSPTTYLFTAPVAGIYHFHANCYTRNNGGTPSDSGTYGYARLIKNDFHGGEMVNFNHIHGYTNHGDSDYNQHISGYCQLLVGDTIGLEVRSDGGGTSSYYGNACFLEGYLVG